MRRKKVTDTFGSPISIPMNHVREGFQYPLERDLGWRRHDLSLGRTSPKSFMNNFLLQWIEHGHVFADIKGQILFHPLRFQVTFD